MPDGAQIEVQDDRAWLNETVGNGFIFGAERRCRMRWSRHCV
jgi:hypothetical protein